MFICIAVLFSKTNKRKTKRTTTKNPSVTIFVELRLLLNMVGICWACASGAEGDHGSEPGIGRRGCPGSAILRGESSPASREWPVSLAADKGTHILCLTLREARALWTIEMASGLTMKSGFRKMLLNKLPPSEM